MVHYNRILCFSWSWSCWNTFFVNLGYEDAGDFTMMERVKIIEHVNLILFLIVGSIGLIGLVLHITMCRILLIERRFCYGMLKYFWTCCGGLLTWFWINK